MKFEIYTARDGLWYWRLKTRNGRIIADGAEGYASASNARRAVKRFDDMMSGSTKAPEVVVLK